ncbi:DUF6479 family protein [Streptomyces beigongshangae]|uniref:DUF6479 family protein n=1 Tax=Streptomyces beigongshangae TaxID=2841597 RepID=UPI001C85A316|nr:DUF6479 family protein [Streptomyces sp. REN17]
MDYNVTPLAASGSAEGGIVPFLIGIIVVGGLIFAVSWGRRQRSKQPPPPRPEEQPRLPESGPVGEVRERREPDEVSRGDRMSPHDLGGGTSHRAPEQGSPTWDRNSGSGSGFGSGGPGPT